MCDFLFDMGPVHPTIYSGSQAASDGLFMSTENIHRLDQLDFSGIGMDKIEFNMDSAYATTFGANPSFPYGALYSEPSTMGGNVLGDWSIPSSSSCAANTAHKGALAQVPYLPPSTEPSYSRYGTLGNTLGSGPPKGTSLLDEWFNLSSLSLSGATNKHHAAAHIPTLPPIKRGFGNDISNIERSTHVHPSLVSSSSSPSSPSSRVSIPDAATPADLLSPVSAPTLSSSSPAGKSAKQRKAPSSTRPPYRPSAPRSRNATTGPVDNRFPCVVQDCVDDFHDKSTMHRHIITVHMRDSPKCPGCGKTYSRSDALGRHLDNTELASKCRMAAMAIGWTEVVRGGKLKMSKSKKTNRAKLIADYIS